MIGTDFVLLFVFDLHQNNNNKKEEKRKKEKRGTGI